MRREVDRAPRRANPRTERDAVSDRRKGRLLEETGVCSVSRPYRDRLQWRWRLDAEPAEGCDCHKRCHSKTGGGPIGSSGERWIDSGRIPNVTDVYCADGGLSASGRPYASSTLTSTCFKIPSSRFCPATASSHRARERVRRSGFYPARGGSRHRMPAHCRRGGIWAASHRAFRHCRHR